MTILVLTLLAALGMAACLFRRRLAATACFTILAALWFGVGCGPVARWLVTSLQASTSSQPIWQSRNVIVLLGAGTTREPDGSVIPSFYANGRILKTAQLYHACMTSGAWCAVEVTGGDPAHSGRSEAQVYGTALAAIGVPVSAIVIEDKSMNTWQNAHLSAAVLNRVKPDGVWLVSSATHLRRAVVYFDHAGIITHPVAADYITATASWLPQAWNFAIADLALHEYFGLWQFHAYEVLGWNAPRGSVLIPATPLPHTTPNH